MSPPSPMGSASNSRTWLTTMFSLSTPTCFTPTRVKACTALLILPTAKRTCIHSLKFLTRGASSQCSNNPTSRQHSISPSSRRPTGWLCPTPPHQNRLLTTEPRGGFSRRLRGFRRTSPRSLLARMFLCTTNSPQATGAPFRSASMCVSHSLSTWTPTTFSTSRRRGLSTSSASLAFPTRSRSTTNCSFPSSTRVQWKTPVA